MIGDLCGVVIKRCLFFNFDGQDLLLSGIDWTFRHSNWVMRKSGHDFDVVYSFH